MTIEDASKAVGLQGGKGAIGRYQLTDPIRQATEAGLNVKTDLFSPENQDKIAISLIKARGITADMIINNPVEAGKRLAMEFAGIPVLAPTQGYVQSVERVRVFIEDIIITKQVTLHQRMLKQHSNNLLKQK